MSSSLKISALVLLVAAAGVVFAEVPESERVPITDPAEIAAMGLSGDAPLIFRRVSNGDAVTIDPSKDDYGILDYNHTALMSHDFVGAKYEFQQESWAEWGIACHTGAVYSWADAQLQLPDGVLFYGVRSWARDTDASDDIHLFVYEHCQGDYTGTDVTSTLLIDDDITSGTTGNQSNYDGASGGPITIDNTSCVYRVRVRLGSGSICQGSGLQLMKVRAEWRRQISPAPATASFSDVPTGHIFFQHIEALVDSGITSGCGATTYCPDAYVTRGQMAVFLAKALGLHWNISNH